MRKISAWVTFLALITACSQSNHTSLDSVQGNATLQASSSAHDYAMPAGGGVIDPARSIDWSQAGVPGGIPTRNTICTTLSPSSTGAQINSAIANCPAGQVVLLSAGTYNISGGIVFNNKNNVTLRGAGPDQTFLKFSSANSCGGWGGDICVINGDPDCAGCGTPSNVANWSMGYAVGTNSVTLSSISNLQVGSVIFLDQLDDSTTDTGQIWVCQTGNACSQQDGSENGRPGRGQQEPVLVTSISGSGPYTIGITPGVRMPNWSASKSPQAHWSNSLPVSGDGIEDLSIDNSNTNEAGIMTAGTMIVNGYGNWISNIRDINSPHEHVQNYQTAHTTIQNSYFYGSFSAESQSYGIDVYNGADILTVNNIFQHIAQSMMTEGCVGCVFGYNYTLDDWYLNGDPDWQEPSSWEHSVGDAFILWEGNEGISLIGDDIHGSHNFVTAFRNYLTGYDPAGGSTNGKTEQTTPVILEAMSRYYNLVGNVLGIPGKYTNYQVNPSSKTDGGNSDTANASIYSLGYSGNEGTYLSPIPNDLVLFNTLMRWGNYDVVTGAAQFNSSEVPSNLSPYGNAVPASHVLPSSLFLASEPGWWSSPFGSPAWPAVGPDVSGGDLSGLNGHVYNTVAELCYAHSPVDSSYSGAADRGVLLFNSKNCYGSSTSTNPTPTPTPPQMPTPTSTPPKMPTPTPTPMPSPSPVSSMPPSGLMINSRIQIVGVVPPDMAHIWTVPSVSTGTVSGREALGSLGTIIAGPTTDSAGTVWYEVKMDDGDMGWDWQNYFALSSTTAPTPTPTPTMDKTPPMTSITSPTNGSTVPARQSLSIKASASDNVGVTRVEFYVNGNLKCTVTSIPYNCNFLVPRNVGRTYKLQTKAYDAAGNVGQSSVVSVTSK